MGSLGAPEIFVVLLIALIVLGPNRLPTAARQVGKALAEFRRMTGSLQTEVRDAFAEPIAAFQETLNGTGPSATPNADLTAAGSATATDTGPITVASVSREMLDDEDRQSASRPLDDVEPIEVPPLPTILTRPLVLPSELISPDLEPDPDSANAAPGEFASPPSAPAQQD